MSTELVTPDQLKVGDIIMCYAHDDQCEQCNARIVQIERDDTPGELLIHDNKGELWAIYPYDYQIWMTCRHVNIQHLEHEGSRPYLWHRFPWNKTTRYMVSPDRATIV